MPGTLLVGLTGGIGSGKSTVCSFLAQIGAAVVDADAIARETTAPGGVAIPAIRSAFGPGFIADDGGLNRVRMRELAFHDADAKRRLEAIIHPLVGLVTQQRINEAIKSMRACVVLDIPLLVESGHWRTKLHRVLVVDCDEQTQIDRVIARSGLAQDEIRRIIASQASRRSRLSSADVVLNNQNRSMEALGHDVRQLAEPFGLSLGNRN